MAAKARTVECAGVRTRLWLLREGDAHLRRLFRSIRLNKTQTHRISHLPSSDKHRALEGRLLLSDPSYVPRCSAERNSERTPIVAFRSVAHREPWNCLHDHAAPPPL